MGTDHGMLPVYLAENELAVMITATDINAEPLSRGMELAREHGVADRIGFILTDGLRGVEPEADTVVIAGMGGETMIGILETASWVRYNNVRLILQPQSKFEELTVWLCDNGYAIHDAELVHDRDKYYVIIEVSAGNQTMDGHFILRRLMEKRDPLMPGFLDQLTRIQRNIVAGLERSDDNEQLQKEKTVYDSLMRMKEEASKWQP